MGNSEQDAIVNSKQDAIASSEQETIGKSEQATVGSSEQETVGKSNRARTGKSKRAKITNELIIAALAYDCPWRDTDTSPIDYVCLKGGRSNCIPRTCGHCIGIFKTMASIADGEIVSPII